MKVGMSLKKETKPIKMSMNEKLNKYKNRNELAKLKSGIV